MGGLLYLKRTALTQALRAAWLDRAPVAWIALLLLLASPPAARWFAATSLPRLQVVYVAGVAAGGLLLMIIYSNQRSTLINTLEYKPIAYLGKISYGLYLYNDYVKVDLPQRYLTIVLEESPISNRITIWASRLLEQTTWAHVLLKISGQILCLGAIIVVAQLSWVFVEKPALSLRGRLLGTPKFSQKKQTVEGTFVGETPLPLDERRTLSA